MEKVKCEVHERLKTASHDKQNEGYRRKALGRGCSGHDLRVCVEVERKARWLIRCVS